MNYGFVIDNRLCIGCHACSTACKSENEVPLGVNRTWVKYVETGVFPYSGREFQVTRCNHCANPPCVEICPVTAMFKRSDGIVDFDSDACIGCKACLQACPYDAIYIDPDSLTAAKCHYCAHRTELGLEPACVVVCPEQAIISGDIDDPQSRIRQLIDNNKVKVRKPESRTKPNLFYIEGSHVTLDPNIAAEKPATYMWSDVGEANTDKSNYFNKSNTNRRVADTDPVQIGGRVAEHMVQVSYDVNHKKAWHWPVAAYLTTKAIAAGTYLMLISGIAMGLADIGGIFTRVMGSIALLATIATGAFLCVDLERPERFLRVIMRPQWSSWLSKGAFLLVGFGAVLGLVLGVILGVYFGVEGLVTVANMMLNPAVFMIWGVTTSSLAVCTAVYTAYLFRQAKGREFWQGKFLPLHMGVQAIVAGSAICLIIVGMLDGFSNIYGYSAVVLTCGLVASGGIICHEHLWVRTPSTSFRIANQSLLSGSYRYWFRAGASLFGNVVPLLLLVIEGAGFGSIAGACTLVGLFCYEYGFILAGQEPPNS